MREKGEVVLRLSAGFVIDYLKRGIKKKKVFLSREMGEKGV